VGSGTRRLSDHGGDADHCISKCVSYYSRSARFIVVLLKANQSSCPGLPKQRHLVLYRLKSKGNGMLVAFFLGPWATFWTLPRSLSLICVLFCACVSGLSLGIRHVQADKPGVAEISTSIISTAMVVTCVLLILYVNLIRRLEDNFDSMPWKRPSGPPSAICSFTGHISEL
jgi:hypothetical protein